MSVTAPQDDTTRPGEVDFNEAWPLSELRPADYNPRKISPDAFLKLQDSLRTLGVVKPVILNRDGTLVAGHQRTRAMKAIGMTHTPALLLDRKVRRSDEIAFNLFHNSIETDSSTATLGGELHVGYQVLSDSVADEG